MKILLLVLISVLASVLNFNSEKNRYSYEISINNSMIHGPYNSWYLNGEKKAEGAFYYNQRTGIWNVYDSTGELRVKRSYSNSFEFEIEEIFNKLTSHSTLLNREKYSLAKNKSNFIEYPVVKEDEVVASKRIWRNVEANNGNFMFFENNALINYILPHLISQSITVYSAIDDNFTLVLDSQAVNDACVLASFNIAGFKILEEWFYSSKRQMSETRIIGICPYIELEGVKRDLFWLYYPEIRSILAQKEVLFENIDSNIQNMEDVFFFRRFSSEIYKESNALDKMIRDYSPSKDISSEAEKIQVSMIEMEHDIWLENAQ